jgi:hypothetical protein
MALAALPYHEPEIVTILIQASFLIVLNGVNWVLDNVIYCGLVGQILIGVAWGTPGANWLSPEVQDTVMQLGYLGLILIVYEGMYTLILVVQIADPFFSKAACQLRLHLYGQTSISPDLWPSSALPCPLACHMS